MCWIGGVGYSRVPVTRDVMSCNSSQHVEGVYGSVGCRIKSSSSLSHETKQNGVIAIPTRER
jgi:hypothetical protein